MRCRRRLERQGYVCGRALATVVFLSLRLGRPLFLEGEAATGKTEIAQGHRRGGGSSPDPASMLRGSGRGKVPSMNGTSPRNR